MTVESNHVIAIATLSDCLKTRPSYSVRVKKMNIVRFFGGELCGTKS